MTLVNINYHGKVIFGLQHVQFSLTPPQQAAIKIPGKYTILVFKSGCCRLMGCKSAVTNKFVACGNIIVRVERIQSITVLYDLGKQINLYELAKRRRVMFEPELFPAARLMEFNPLCVNVFASGKVVVTGLKTLDYCKQMEKILCALSPVT